MQDDLKIVGVTPIYQPRFQSREDAQAKLVWRHDAQGTAVVNEELRRRRAMRKK